MVSESEVKGSLFELRRGVIAAVATLVVSVIVSYFIPDFQSSILKPSEELSHERTFTKLPNGATIEYKGQSPEILEKDLTILSHRFKRGQFEMVSLAGSKNSTQVQALIPVKDRFTYEVTQTPTGAIMRIQSGDPGAIRSLHDYADYLKERFQF